MNTKLSAAARGWWTHGARWDVPIVIVALAMTGALWAVNLERIAREHEHAISAAERQNSNLAIALEEHILRTFKSASQAVLQVAREFDEEGLRLDIARFVRDGSIDHAFLTVIGIADERGTVLLDSLHTGARLDFSGHDFFAAHRGSANRGLFIGTPLRGPLSGEWAIPVSVRLSKPDGSFAGVVFAGIFPGYFTDFYSRADIGSDGVINLMGLDGITRARRAGDRISFGEDSSKSTLFAMQRRSPSGHFLSRGAREGKPRFQSYRTLADFPLVVSVGTSKAEVLADFNERRRYYVLGSVLATAFIAVLAVTLLAGLARQRHARREVEFKNTLFTTQQDVSLDAILVVDENGRVLSYNRPFLDLWNIPEDLVGGADDERLLARVLDEIVNPEAFLARIRELYVHRNERSREEIRTRSGQIIDRYSAPMTGPDGAYFGRIWYFRDVTERRCSEERLRESERRFASMMDNVQMVSIMLDREARITYCNDYLLNLTGWRREEIIGRSWFDLFVPPELVEMKQVFADLIADVPEAWHHDNEILTKSGERRLIRWHNTVLRSIAGEVVGTASLGEDITEQDSARREIEFKNTLLTTQQDMSLDAILLVDENERIVSYNRPFIELWGIPEELGKAGKDGPVLRCALEKIADPAAFLARVRHLYAHREEKSHDEIHTRAGQIIDRYSAPVIGPNGTYFGRVWYFRDVTSRRLNEKLLRESEQRFRQMAETIGEVFWMASADCASVIYVSPAFEAIWARRCDELMEQPALWLEAVEAEDRPLVERSLAALSQGMPYDIEYRIRRPDGALRWINDRGYAMRDERGRVALTSGLATDITERKRAAAAVADLQTRLQAALTGGNVGLWDWDLLTNQVFYSSVWKQQLGYGESELGGELHIWERLMHPDDLEPAYRAVERCMADPAARYQIEFRMKHKSGEWRWMLAQGAVHRNAEQLPVRFVGCHIDVTERKLIEEQQRLSDKVISSIADGVVVTDAERRIVFVNDAFSRITGYTREEAIGQTPALKHSGRQDAAFYAAMWGQINESGHWQGEVWNRRKNGEVYPELLSVSAVRNGGGAVSNYVGVFTDISASKQYEERLHYLAHHDALTGLSNRILFHDRFREALGRARRQGGKAAVLFLDLDHFKNINDCLGHDVGDLLLQAVGRRITQSVREIDTVARFGGDEFAVLLEAIDDNQAAAAVARKLVEALALPFQIGEHQFFISVSIGISCFPQDGADPETLSKNADTAMYRAKAEGRNNYQFFSEEMNARALENLQMGNDMRAGLERGEFLLHYQPRVDLESGEVTGAEALVRWQHPLRGLVPPGRFIPLAEESGLIEALGEWVLRSACRQMRAWLDGGVPVERIAVNLSARQFRHPDLPKLVAGILEETGVPARHLELEVTESMVMQKPADAAAVLAKLKAMGIAIAVDDFGTGYSSLGYLKRFPLDFLKIDQSFIRGVPSDAEDAVIVETIIAMAKSLKLRIIAEGVETPAQRLFLLQQGCEEAQGYLFSRPVPAVELEEFLKRSAAPAEARRNLAAAA